MGSSTWPASILRAPRLFRPPVRPLPIAIRSSSTWTRTSWLLTQRWPPLWTTATRVSAETFRRIACDAALVPTLTGAPGASGGSASSVLDIGRRSRVIPTGHLPRAVDPRPWLPFPRLPPHPLPPRPPHSPLAARRGHQPRQPGPALPPPPPNGPRGRLHRPRRRRRRARVRLAEAAPAGVGPPAPDGRGRHAGAAGMGRRTRHRDHARHEPCPGGTGQFRTTTGRYRRC